METPASDVSASESKKETPVFHATVRANMMETMRAMSRVQQDVKLFLSYHHHRSAMKPFFVEDDLAKFLRSYLQIINKNQPVDWNETHNLLRVHVQRVTTAASALPLTPQKPVQPPLSEAEVEFLEMQIPALAGAATQKAYWEALSGGASVVCTRGRELVEVAPDGTKRVLDTLEEGSSLPVGTVLSL